MSVHRLERRHDREPRRRRRRRRFVEKPLDGRSEFGRIFRRRNDFNFPAERRTHLTVLTERRVAAKVFERVSELKNNRVLIFESCSWGSLWDRHKLK